MATPLSQVLHLYSRFGFGLTYPAAEALGKKDLSAVVEALVTPSTTGAYLTAIGKDEVPLRKTAAEQGMNGKAYQQLVTDKLRALNLAWMNKLLVTEQVLLEKQTLFWHNHFACRVRQPWLMQELNNVQRRFAFSSFRELLVEVCKSPAMLLYLNNHQNRKEHPNENFARELMELFTLGRGHYSEEDVREVARAFTGWGIDRETGDFEFKLKQHDTGEKTIFGRKGNFGGEDVINMLISNKQTAFFLCKKMYRYYVNESVNDAHVAELAEFYYQSQYNTGALLKKIMTSAWFWEPVNRGCNIKAPVDFLITLSRQFNIRYTDETLLFRLQRALGQQLFYPPNVAGWPGGRYYIDSSKLLFRLGLPAVLLNNGSLEVAIESDDADAPLPGAGKTPSAVAPAAADWESVLNANRLLNAEKLIKLYLRCEPLAAVADVIRAAYLGSPKAAILKIVSLPEYSLH